MKLGSLGYGTDLMFRAFEGEILDRDGYLGYLVIRTPRNPSFRWGNYLLFRNAPRGGDLVRWTAAFVREIGSPPSCQHLAFGWDSTEKGDVEPFQGAGFSLMQNAVLSARSVHPPPRLNAECRMRALRSSEWTEWVEMERAVDAAQPAEKRHGSEEHRVYLEGRAGEYQRMIDAGLGTWFGAFLDGRLVASLGLFIWNGLGRFQVVGTHPGFRRRGLCGTLVHHAARQGLERMGAETLVMVADPDDAAIGVYESVGFLRGKSEWGLERRLDRERRVSAGAGGP